MPGSASDPARAIRVVRDLLSQADFSSSGIARLGIDVGLGVRAIDVPLLARALQPAEPLATLVRLFVLGERIDAEAVRRRLMDGADAIVAAGLAVRDGGDVAATVRLTPWRGLIVAHDADPATDLWPAHVSGPTPAAESLLRVVSTTGGQALDLGTGCGLLALALAPQQEGVVATDVNDAALGLAELNARLNDIPNIRTVAGSLFEPVADESFDLVVSNPPFVISPDSDLVFRHSRYGRDEISAEVVRGSAAHLRDGGFAYAMVNWVHAPGDPWLAPLRRWLADTGCDAVCLLHGIEDPLSYALRWNQREQILRPDALATTIDRWLAHFRREGIEAVGSGLIILRRRSGPNWVHGVELDGDARGDAGRQVQAIFAGRDFLGEPGEAVADGRILRSAFRIDAPHRLVQSLVSRDGEYVVEPARLVVDEGLEIRTTIEPDLIPAVLRLDGTQTVSDIAREIAEAAGDVSGANERRVADLVRALVERGIATNAERGR